MNGSPEMLLVGSKTKAALKAHGCNVGGDALGALNMVVHWYVEQAAKRAADRYNDPITYERK